MEKFNFYSKYIYRIKFKKGMLAKGELGPSNKPAPTDSYPLPLLIYSPSPLIKLLLTHGLKNSPDPAASIFIPFPFFFAYTTPLPAILSTIAEPAEDPTPANNPVARAGTTLVASVLPNIPNNGKRAPINPPSTFALYANCFLLSLSVTPVPFSYAFAILFNEIESLLGYVHLLDLNEIVLY